MYKFTDNPASDGLKNNLNITYMLLPKNKFSMISFQFLDQAMGVEIMESESASKRERTS